MTIILTLFGLLVFIFSLFTAGFKSACKRLAAFAITGIILDVILICLTLGGTYAFYY